MNRAARILSCVALFAWYGVVIGYQVQAYRCGAVPSLTGACR